AAAARRGRARQYTALYWASDAFNRMERWCLARGVRIVSSIVAARRWPALAALCEHSAPSERPFRVKGFAALSGGKVRRPARMRYATAVAARPWRPRQNWFMGARPSWASSVRRKGNRGQEERGSDREDAGARERPGGSAQEDDAASEQSVGDTR